HPAVGTGRVAGATVEAATVEAHDHGALATRFCLWRVDVQHEAVFAHAAGLNIIEDKIRIDVTAIAGYLRRDLAVAKGVAHTAPFCYRLRWQKAIFSTGVRSIVNTPKYGHAAVGQPA